LPVSHSLFRLFYLVEIRHRELRQSQTCTPKKVQCQYGNSMIIYFSSSPPRAMGSRRPQESRARHVDAPQLMSQWLPNVVNGWTVGAGHPNQLEVSDQVNAMIEGFLRHYA
jgi:hypothetical protein